MLKYWIQGLLLGFAYVAPIGMQNIYVINSAVVNKRIKAYMVACIVIFFDISLALACFFGIGSFMEKYEILKMALLFLGSIAVMWIGISLIKSKVTLKDDVDVNKSLLQMIITCFLITWVNPQALIDGSLLLGSYKAILSKATSQYFIVGVMMASATWFLTITTLVTRFKNFFNVKVIKMINIVCGSILLFYGIKLGYHFIMMIK